MPLRTPICDLLGIEHPVLLAGMGGVSYAELCAAVSQAGGFGSLGMAGLSPRVIREQMRKVRDLTDKPFGVDLLTALPDSLTRSVDVILEGGAKAFIAGLGVPSSILGRLKDAGVVVMSMCGTVRHARRAEEAGVDVVIAQGTEGGGHTGKVAGMALLPMVVDAVSIPTLAAGGLFDGRGLAAALAFGAQGVWMGTRFIATHEAHAAQAYKDAIVRARDEDTIVTRCYTGKTMRVIENDYVREWEQQPGKIQPFPQQAIVSAQSNVMGGIGGKVDGLDPARDCLAAGQSCGGVREVLPAGDIVRAVVREAESVLGRIGAHAR